MRVTHKMIIDRVTNNLDRAFSSYLDLQAMVSNGRRINKPSDDPIGITKALTYRNYIDELTQYRRNMDRCEVLLNFSDLAFDSINSNIISIQDMAVQLQNDTYDEIARAAAAEQVDDLLKQVLDAGNTEVENRYIFAGSKTSTKPFDFNGTGVVYRGNDGDVSYNIDRGDVLNASISGSDFLVKPVMTLGQDHDLNPAVARNTLLKNLHGGTGVDLGDYQFILRTLNGEVTIDLTGIISIGGVIDAINAQAPVNVAASISEVPNSITIEDTSDPYMTWNTPLSMLNRGNGVNLTVPQFEIKDGPNTWVVNVAGATALQDIKDAIDAQAIPDLQVSLTPEANSLTITDTSGPPPAHAYTINDLTGGTVAADLGITTSEPIAEPFIGGDLDPVLIQTEETGPDQRTAADLGLLFSSFQMMHVGDDLDPRLTMVTKLSNLKNGNGIDFSQIRIVVGHDYFDVDLEPLNSDPNAILADLFDLVEGSGAKVRMYMNEDRKGVILESTVTDQSLIVYDQEENGAAYQLGIAGSPDLIGSIIYLRNGFEKGWRDTSQSVIDRLQLGNDQILVLRATTGSRINRINSARSKNLNNEIYATKLLSEIEDADMIWAIMELSTRESVYQTAMAAAAQVIQPSLVNFLS